MISRSSIAAALQTTFGQWAIAPSARLACCSRA
eukprot:CAMPEP_0181410424 /NCGR_PEP_ID=MMETSP1110-20121109/7330_1 /TAXON_ID=174948 /ORGANISM="Symbiodinium sp., Strain CCMP421" /LENGTH=32 /DNA_ID= /DNA_START= /DNA_END= /DNA_ORIENTATION=